MSGINERRHAMDAKLAHDSELKFKVITRRNQLLGFWAAGRMKLKGAAIEGYARSVVHADFEEAGENDVLRKVQADLAESGDPLDAAGIRAEMDRLRSVAMKQVMAEAGG